MTKSYDITIIGGGPSGISLCMMLLKTGKSVQIIEREKSLGGCWRIEWDSNKYYTEHSPHITTDGYKRFHKLCDELGVENSYKKTYKYHSAFLSVYLSDTVVKNLSAMDIIKITSGFIMSRIVTNKQTVLEFSESLSDKGKKTIYLIAVTAATVPERMMMQDIFEEMSRFPPSLQQMTRPEDWLKAAEDRFEEEPNVTLTLNKKVTSVRKINEGFLINDDIVSKQCIFALPPIALYKILEKSDNILQNNWLPFAKLKEWAYGSYYASIGFQLHFDIDVKYDEMWCKSCAGEWNIIILPMSNYLDEYSKDSTIKTVWSCTIVDQTGYSSRLRKKVHECTLVEIEKECIKQLQIPKPKVFTFYNGLYKENGYYMSKDTGFARQKFGTLPHEGKIKNLYIVSTVNQKGIINMESALKSSYEFIKEYHNGYETLLELPVDSSLLKLLIIILIITTVMSLFSRIRM
jgi:hypothetical protein